MKLQDNRGGDIKLSFIRYLKYHTMWQESRESFTLLNKTHKISVFSVHIWPNLTSPFLPNRCLPAVWISCVHEAVWSQHYTCSRHCPCFKLIQHGVFGQQTGPLVHLTRWLGNNYVVARGGRLLCIGIVLTVLPPEQCISHFIMSGKGVFHTTWARRERDAYQGWWGLPVVSHRW